ncbi:type II toxin-antitoxin system VapC family toxin [Desulfoscipio gibsoniae]|uniref:Putative nucleic acid-binding protein, contains PIN domain n=1 Tax=Desulfoscipio gibsoniae DSM 7213 TaxID=767817 RepID=R4KPV3_9FIRM|nr:PIN domain-containing protein [Desulfoscipio gibsoniae]AGL01681.1 putative nucleic acid-binding protein, contains PIN domain [Desulfoscipio gibsoniae DSM 7213]
MGSIEQLLRDVEKVALDTNIIIYLLEQNHQFFTAARDIFDLIESGSVRGITSALSLTEVLTKPYKTGDYTLANEYKLLFRYFPNFCILDVNAVVSERAAWLRARYGLKTPDAIFAATALVGEADVFISNDSDLYKVDELKVINLNNLT